MVITVSATLQGFDHNQARAGASLGASPTVVFFRIVLPLILPGVISGALFAFVTSFDEVVVALFVTGPAERTLPRQMFNGIRENISPVIAAAATMVILLSVLLLTVLELSDTGQVFHVIGRPSWIAIVILTAAMISPTTPRRTLVGSLIAASMGPVGVIILYGLGRPVPPLSLIALYYLPTYIWAVVATMSSAMFHRMGRQIKEARELLAILAASRKTAERGLKRH